MEQTPQLESGTCPDLMEETKTVAWSWPGAVAWLTSCPGWREPLKKDVGASTLEVLGKEVKSEAGRQTENGWVNEAEFSVGFESD